MFSILSGMVLFKPSGPFIDILVNKDRLQYIFDRIETVRSTPTNWKRGLHYPTNRKQFCIQIERNGKIQDHHYIIRKSNLCFLLYLWFML